MSVTNLKLQIQICIKNVSDFLLLRKLSEVYSENSQTFTTFNKLHHTIEVLTTDFWVFIFFVLAIINSIAD